LYVEASKGFRSGNITSNSLINAANLVLGTHFPPSAAPDTLWNYEIGSKSTLLDGRINVELSAYHFDWKDAQIELSPAGTPAVIPVGNVNSNGVDAGIVSHLTRNVDAEFNGNFNQTRLHGVAPSITAALPFIANGRQIPLTPTFTTTAGLSYHTLLSNTGYQFRVGGRYSIRSGQESSFDGITTPTLRLASLQAGVDNGHYRFEILGENITDSRGPASANGGQFLIPYPRQIGAALEVVF
jgi:outer membrane receptor protein involved in Fe transport